jgi:hypothetical protein
MRNPLLYTALLAAPLALGACATTNAPVDVTRFHLDSAIERGSVIVEPAPGGDPQSLEFKTYADAVQAQLEKVGYAPAERLGTSLLVAVVTINRDSREPIAKRSPVSVGIGGGSGGYGGGVGGGISFGLGGKPGATLVTQLSVQLKRRADQSVVWEGRAISEVSEKSQAAQPAAIATKLAAALFGDFPGESGRTIRVK